MRLIDADALREVHCEGCSSEEIRNGCKNDPVCATLMWVDEAPTIDAVPVVRCKDCKNVSMSGYTGKLFCTRPLGSYACVLTKKDNFCSYGERRADNGID